MTKPFLKWVGGKRHLLPVLLPLLHELRAGRAGRFLEPFLGGGAVFFGLSEGVPLPALLNDVNSELINTYQIMSRSPDLLRARVGEADLGCTLAAFLSVRGWDRLPNWPKNVSALDRAARFVYLNRSAFNGIWRVNSKEHFNVPFGRYKNLSYPKAADWQASAAALRSAKLFHLDFATFLAQARPGDVVYLDPPYIPASKTASFTSYAAGGFKEEDHVRLAKVCSDLTAAGITWVLSNSDTLEARRLFALPGTDVKSVQVARSVAAKGGSRHRVGEIIVLSRGASVSC